ncbi:MAG: hypothetical protein MZW92_55535 [Comamonadaceae bacterium]|nr:hypothetical protein [Comamonadaceae bacterium]
MKVCEGRRRLRPRGQLQVPYDAGAASPRACCSSTPRRSASVPSATSTTRPTISRDGGVQRARHEVRRPEPSSTPVPVHGVERGPRVGRVRPACHGRSNPDAADAASATAQAFSAHGRQQRRHQLSSTSSARSRRAYKTLRPGRRALLRRAALPEGPGASVLGLDVGRRRRTRTGRGWSTASRSSPNWDDPIQYSCQRNFVLGIGDVNAHYDRNLPGATGGTSEPAKPAEVSADKYGRHAVAATNKVGCAARHG